MLLGNFMLSVDLRIARQRQPVCRGDSRPAKPIGPVALGGEHQIKAAGFAQARVEIDVCVDGPEDGRMQLGRQAIVEPIIDMDEEVKPLAGDLVKLMGRKWVTSTSRSRRAGSTRRSSQAGPGHQRLPRRDG